MTESIDSGHVPESWHHTDPETLREVDMWISFGHPQECLARSKSLLGAPSPKYAVTAQRLIAHCVEAHGEGFWILKEMYCHYFPHEPEKVGLATAVRANQTKLVEEILTQRRSLNGQPEAAYAASLVARYIDESHFQRLWKATWGDGLARENLQIGGQSSKHQRLTQPGACTH